MKSTFSLPLGSWMYAVCVVALGAALLPVDWPLTLKVSPGVTFENISALMLVIATLVAFILAAWARWRAATLAFSIPLTFVAAMLTANAPFEPQTLGMAGQAAQIGLTALMLLAVATSVLVTRGAKDTTADTMEGQKNALRTIALAVFFALPPVSAGCALYFARRYALGDEYPPPAFYIETVFIIATGLVVALIVGLIAELSVAIIGVARNARQSVTDLAHAFSRKLAERRPWWSHHHPA